ncbi:hypothetical protein BOX15_Mlig007573g1, partial [Macrostomum lignano]
KLIFNFQLNHQQQSVMDSTSRTPSERSRLYKNKDKDGEELRRRRNDASVELRKASKTDQMMKRRNIDLAAGDDDEDVALGDGQQQASGKVLSPLRDANNVLANASIDDICKAMKSGSPADQFAAIQACRRALSKERHPPIDEFVNRGVLPELVVALTKPANHQVVFEAAWALTNIASGEAQHTRAVVNAGALQPLIELLNSEHLNVAEQAVWALGNIAGDGSELRDRAIKAGIVQPLLRLLQRVSRDSAIAASSSSSGSDNSVSLLGNCAWLVSNLCRNKNPPPPASAVLELLPAMAALLQAPHKEVVQDTCWALSYVTDAVNDLIGQVIASGVLPTLVALLDHTEAAIVTPALRTIGNIVTGTDQQTDTALAAGFLPKCHRLLLHNKPNIVKEAAWALSNVLAGSQPQIQQVIDNNLIPPLIGIVINGDFKAKKEATWALTNMVTGGDEAQISYLANQNVVPALCEMLSVQEAKIVCIVMESLTALLSLAKKYNQADDMCIAIEGCGGLDKLEALQEHENPRVYEMSLQMIEEFFGNDEDGGGNESGAAAAGDGAGQMMFSAPTDGNAPAGGFKF